MLKFEINGGQITSNYQSSDDEENEDEEVVGRSG